MALRGAEDSRFFMYAKVAEEAACIAGKDIVYEAALLRERQGHCSTTRQKSTFCDLVTESDEKAEKFIIKYIKDKLTNDKVEFLGEESIGTAGKLSLTDAPTFIIDPIDGTSNFVHGYPAFVVSVGVVVNKQLVAGVIYDPSLANTYTAVRGHGAFQNHHHQLKVSGRKQLKDSLILAGTGGIRDPEQLDIVFRNFRAVNDLSHGIRTTGSCAYNLMTVASGSGDGFFDTGIHCWDTCAGALLVSEAGGVVQGLPPVQAAELLSNHSEKFDLMARNILACSSVELAAELRAVLKPIATTRDADDVVYCL